MNFRKNLSIPVVTLRAFLVACVSARIGAVVPCAHSSVRAGTPTKLHPLPFPLFEASFGGDPLSDVAE